MWRSRQEAGKSLALKLRQYKNTDAIVLALPRGGVVIGYEIANYLNLPLDIVVTRKIGHPNNPEYALCAVDETGQLLCDEYDKSFIDQTWLQHEVKKEKKEALRRLRVYKKINRYNPSRIKQLSLLMMV